MPHKTSILRRPGNAPRRPDWRTLSLLCLMSYSVPVLAREIEEEQVALSASVEEAAPPGVLTLQQLENLRRAVPPRLVQVLDWKNYAGSGHIRRRGILYTYRDLRARQVFLAGDFSGWNRLLMHRNRQGVFFAVVPVREVEEGRRFDTYRYRFNIDGIWTHDPTQVEREEDGAGGYVSVFRLEAEEEERHAGPRVLRREQQSDLRLVEFAVHESALRSSARRDRIDNVSIVGDFNHWNPEADLLRRGSDGVYRLRLRLVPGNYLYRLVVDGRWVLDPFNEQVRYHGALKERYSIIEVR